MMEPANRGSNHEQSAVLSPSEARRLRLQHRTAESAALLETSKALVARTRQLLDDIDISRKRLGSKNRLLEGPRN
jgi:hypothetical protein